MLRMPAIDGLGRVLLPAGERLLARHIAKLADLGVSTLDIDPPGGEEEFEPPALVPEEAKAVVRRLDEVFRGAAQDRLMRDLRALAQERLLRHPELRSLAKRDRHG